MDETPEGHSGSAQETESLSYIKEEDVEVTISEADHSGKTRPEAKMEGESCIMESSKNDKTSVLVPGAWSEVQRGEFSSVKEEQMARDDESSSSENMEGDSLDQQIASDSGLTSEESFSALQCQKLPIQIGHFLDRSEKDEDSFIMEENSDSDEKNERDKPYSCNICNKRFTYMSQFKMHSVIHTGERPFVCKLCNKSFTQYGNLKTHYGVHTGERPHSCPVCDRKFRKLGNLKKHHQIHTGDKPFACSECDEKFPLLSRLKKHLRIHTGEPPDDIVRRHECNICKKKFTQPNDLRRHILIHTGERPYVCRECGKGFIRSSALREHSRVHTGEKPYACGVCSRQFSNLNNLNLHLRSHSNVCGVCGKRFVSAEKLERHSNVHVGGKLCPRKGRKKTATANGLLEQEALAKAGDKPYVCTTCQKRFATSSNLNHHCHTHLQEKDSFNPEITPYTRYDKNSGLSKTLLTDEESRDEEN